MLRAQVIPMIIVAKMVFDDFFDGKRPASYRTVF